MAAVMNARGREILNILLQSNDYVKVDEIAGQINVSKRSIYYDIYQINDWLCYYGLPELSIVRKKGILVPEDIKREIEDSKMSNIKKSYVSVVQVLEHLS